METHKAELANPLVDIVPKKKLFPNKMQKHCQQCIIIDMSGSCLKKQMPHMGGIGRT